MATCSSGGANKIQSQISTLKQQLVDLMQRDYTGRKNWDKQLESRTKQAAKLQKQIDKLERQKSKPKTDKKSSKSAGVKSKWQKAGRGWYVYGGKGGFEIRENNNGGYDIVKVKGSNVNTVKSFSKLSQAREYSPK